MTHRTKTPRESSSDAIVRIDKRTNEVLSNLAKQRNEDKKKVLAYSVEMLRRQQMLDSLCDAYRELRNDSEAWSEEQAERTSWENAALSGLKNE
jgi:hypothetical protein